MNEEMDKNPNQTESESQTESQKAETIDFEKASEGKVEENDNSQDLGLDRDNLSDEEYIEKLEEKIGLCLKDSMMCRTLTQRLQADFDNYRKRNATLADDMKKLGISMVIEKMLTVLDNCTLARKYIQDETALQGFNMMETQIVSALETFNLKEIEAEGKEFDAKTMNALERVQSDDNKDKVIEIVSKGYMLDGKVLRPAGVKVGC